MSVVLKKIFFFLCGRFGDSWWRTKTLMETRKKTEKGDLWKMY